MARRRSSAPWRSHQTLEGRTSQSGRAARPRCAETRTSSKTGALFRPSRGATTATTFFGAARAAACASAKGRGSGSRVLATKASAVDT